MAGVSGRRFVTASIAAAGVLGGHWLTYRVSVPHADSRTAALAATGHGYLSLAGELVTLLVAVALASVFVGALMDAGSRARPGRALAVLLSALQVGAFFAMELLERVVAGSSVGDLVGGDILPIGVVANVGVALLGAAMLRWILRTADRVAQAIGTGPAAAAIRRTTLSIPLPHPSPRSSILTLAAAPARGPPSPVRP